MRRLSLGNSNYLLIVGGILSDRLEVTFARIPNAL